MFTENNTAVLDAPETVTNPEPATVATIDAPVTPAPPATIDAPAPAPLSDEQIKAMAAQLKEARAQRKQQAIDAKAAERERIESILAEIGPKAESIGYKLVKGRKSRSTT